MADLRLAALLLMQPALLASNARAEEVPQIVVIGSTPLPGAAVDADRFPGNVQRLSGEELARTAGATLGEAMNERFASINVNDTLADPLQQDILYRGFAASPVLGASQGLAVYQDGVRINEAFGDSVNWDLIPDIAISRVELVSGSPLFGLNALGGAVSITMKDGFGYHGARAELAGGSFGQRSASAELGLQRGPLALYVAARSLGQQGWRRFASDKARNAYLDLGLHGDGPAFNLSVAHADNALQGQGAAPVQSLALGSQNVFTGPQANDNGLTFATLRASLPLANAVKVQGLLYWRRYTQSIANGNTTSYAACAAAVAAGALCQADGLTPLLDYTGNPIPDITQGGTVFIGQNDLESIRSRSRGASLQLTASRPLLGHVNQFALGLSLDAADTAFFSEAEVGTLDAWLLVQPSPYRVATPEGTAFTATPVSLAARNRTLGAFATNTLDLDARLSLTMSARFNRASIDLSDQRGSALTGSSQFNHLNPALGATYRLAGSATLYAGFSTNNRAPTASEIECSDPLRPCLLPSSLAADPPTLRQVIAHTVEVGARGRRALASQQASISWMAGAFRTDLADDIYGIASASGTGYFRNIGATRRQGFEAGLDFQGLRWSVSAQYSRVEASFRSAMTVHSPSNPYQDASGNIAVKPGARIPLIPADRFKLGVDWRVIPRLSLGVTVSIVGSSYYRGDESNQAPPLPGYAIVGLRSTCSVTEKFELQAGIRNLLDAHYSTYGQYSDPTGIGAPGVPPGAAANDPGVDNRFQSPAMPRAFYAGVQARF